MQLTVIRARNASDGSNAQSRRERIDDAQGTFDYLPVLKVLGIELGATVFDGTCQDQGVIIRVLVFESTNALAFIAILSGGHGETCQRDGILRQGVEPISYRPAL